MRKVFPMLFKQQLKSART